MPTPLLQGATSHKVWRPYYDAYGMLWCLLSHCRLPPDVRRDTVVAHLLDIVRVLFRNEMTH